MILQLVGLAGIVSLLWFLGRERQRYEHIERMKYMEHRQERRAQTDARDLARTGDVTAAPINAPVYPIEFARQRRANDDRRPSA